MQDWTESRLQFASSLHSAKPPAAWFELLIWYAEDSNSCVYWYWLFDTGTASAVVIDEPLLTERHRVGVLVRLRTVNPPLSDLEGEVRRRGAIDRHAGQ